MKNAISSFLIDTTAGGDEIVVTYISSCSKHHYCCLHWISSTPTANGLIRDGEVVFLELVVDIGPLSWRPVLWRRRREAKC